MNTLSLFVQLPLAHTVLHVCLGLCVLTSMPSASMENVSVAMATFTNQEFVVRSSLSNSYLYDWKNDLMQN